MMMIKRKRISPRFSGGTLESTAELAGEEGAERTGDER